MSHPQSLSVHFVPDSTSKSADKSIRLQRIKTFSVALKLHQTSRKSAGIPEEGGEEIDAERNTTERSGADRDDAARQFTTGEVSRA